MRSSMASGVSQGPAYWLSAVLTSGMVRGVVVIGRRAADSNTAARV